MKSTSQQKFHPRPTALAASALVGALMLTACGGGDGDGLAIDTGIDNTLAQPVISAQVKSVLTIEGKQFKDSNGNGQLDKYEDWRRSVDQRVDDLVGKMTLEENSQWQAVIRHVVAHPDAAALMVPIIDRGEHELDRIVAGMHVLKSGGAPSLLEGAL